MWGVRWYAAKDDEPLGFADVSTNLEAGELKLALEMSGWTVYTWEISRSGFTLSEPHYECREAPLIA